jgi:hypothetical protein
LAVFGLASPAGADTLKVKNQKDSGPGSLRQTIAESADGDRVVVPKGTYELKSGSLVIATDIEVDGAGSSKTVIDARKDSRVFDVTVTAFPVEISQLAVIRGKADEGAGIFNLGGLTLDDVLVTKNRASDSGGGIENEGDLEVIRSQITRNKVVAKEQRGYGGAIASSSTPFGVIELTRSSLTRNKVRATEDAAFGGAIYFTAPDHMSGLILDKTTISGNTASGDLSAYGGGIYLQPTIAGGVSDSFRVVESTVSNNLALGGDEAGFGGGLYFEALATGSGTTSAFSLENSTVAGNLASGDSGALGGGLFLHPVASAGASTPQTISNSTIAGNEAAGPGSDGGGINSGSVGGIATAANSIVADNTAKMTDNCAGPMDSLEGNLERGISCTFNDPNDVGPANPKLGTLRNNGGPTQTMALPEESPAVDQGLSGNCLSTDQRGVDRPQGAFCDIGAFEFEQ